MLESLLSVAGVTTVIVFVLTLLFQYFPGLRDQWAAVASDKKKLIVLGAYLVIGAVVAFGGCFPQLAAVIPQLLCVPSATFVSYALAVAAAVGAGQGVFSLLPEMKDVKAVKAAREAAMPWQPAVPVAPEVPVAPVVRVGPREKS